MDSSSIMLGALTASSVVLRSVSRSTVMSAAPTVGERVSYHIGTHGKPWSVDERKQWLAERVLHRSYKEEVVAKLDALRERSEYEVLDYGALTHDASRYPLYAVKSRDWDVNKPTALVSSVLQPAATAAASAAATASATASAASASTQAHKPTPTPPRPHASPGDRRRARIRDKRRPGRAALPADGGRGVQRRLQPAGRALCQPLGLRDGAAVERAGGRPEPLLQPRRRGGGRPLVQP